MVREKGKGGSVAEFVNATRSLTSVLAPIEKRTLVWLAERMPRSINSDHLTALALVAMGAAGAFYALARVWPPALILVNVMLAINWFGDSLDGTLARVRNRQRPRYGFYVDHIVDCIGATLLLIGLGLSGYMHLTVALALLIAYLLLSAEVYLATYTRHTFTISYFKLGPTELRILLAIANLAVLVKPSVTLIGYQVPFFDIAGVVGAIGLGTVLLVSVVRNTSALYGEERLPD
jgi:phosphatidylglycerophosphate synthase